MLERGENPDSYNDDWIDSDNDDWENEDFDCEDEDRPPLLLKVMAMFR
jgi:hypothetical protein